MNPLRIPPTCLAIGLCAASLGVHGQTNTTSTHKVQLWKGVSTGILAGMPAMDNQRGGGGLHGRLVGRGGAVAETPGNLVNSFTLLRGLLGR